LVSSRNIRNVSFIFRKLIFYDLIDKRKPTQGGLFGVCYG
jgi:hypothetical protein